MGQKTLFLGTISIFLKSMETLKNYFTNSLAVYGIPDFRSNISASEIQNNGNPVIILSKKVEDIQGVGYRAISINIKNEQSCNVSIRFTSMEHEYVSFTCDLEKIAGEEVLKKFADFFLDDQTNFFRQSNREKFKTELRKVIRK